MTSKEVRKLVASGEITAEEAVGRLMTEADHPLDQNVVCRECGTTFYCSALDPNDPAKLGRVNTCSDICQMSWNMAVMELDGGRTIHRVQEFTSERLDNLFGAVGLGITSGKKVTLS